MDIQTADKLHHVWRKTGLLQTCGCEETNRVLAKWASEESAQKEQDKRWEEKHKVK